MINIGSLINIIFAIILVLALVLGIVLLICRKWKIALMLAVAVVGLPTLLVLFYASLIPTGDMVDESNTLYNEFEAFVESHKEILPEGYDGMSCSLGRRSIAVSFLFYNEAKIPEEYIS